MKPERLMEDKNHPARFDPQRVRSFVYPLGLVILVLAALLFIEFKHPYFFLQDDNRDYYLPYFIHNYRSLITGELALYNFHQFLGSPELALGQSAVLYPLTYLSVFLSSLVFGHYFAAIEIQAILHLLIGAVGFYKFLRFFDIEHRVSFWGGLTWSLSSFIVYVSNSWIIVAGPAAFFPWMLLFSFHLYKTPSRKAAAYAVIVRLLLFYTGHIQYFIYSVIFEFITISLYIIFDSERGKKWSALIKFQKIYFAGYIYVFIFSLPLLLPFWHQMTISARRSDQLPFNIFVSEYFPVDQLLKGLFFPFLQANENTYASWRNLLNLSHIGYLPILFLSLGMLERIIHRSKKFMLNSKLLTVFIIPAVLAFLWATGWAFNLIIYVIPILNRFRWPFKLAFYLDFYLIVISALFLFHFLARRSWKKTTKSILLWLIIVLQVFNLVFLYTALPYKDFGEHHADTLPLKEDLLGLLKDGRIISAGFDTWTPSPQNDHPYFTAPTLGFNYATLWGLDYFAGYEPLISASNARAGLGLKITGIIGAGDQIPVEYLRKAGVKWYIVPGGIARDYANKLGAFGMMEIVTDENRVVFSDAQAYPMVYYSNGEKNEALDYKVTTNTIETNIDFQQPEIIEFNYLYNPFFEGFIDGRNAPLAPVNDIHISLSVPSGKHHILIRYQDPYFLAGIYIVLGFLFILVFFWAIKYVSKRKFRPQNSDMHDKTDAM